MEDTVDQCKYPGVYIHSEVDWGKNTEALFTKTQSCLYFLPSFNILQHLQDDAEGGAGPAGGGVDTRDLLQLFCFIHILSSPVF